MLQSVSIQFNYYTSYLHFTGICHIYQSKNYFYFFVNCPSSTAYYKIVNKFNCRMNGRLEDFMSDLAATNCGCGCDGGNNNCFFLILILLFCCGGCGNGNGFFGGGDCCSSIIWLFILFSCCGCGNGIFGGNGNGCGCGC